MGNNLSEPMDYNHESVCAIYAANQERARILEIIRKMNKVFLYRDDLIAAIEA